MAESEEIAAAAGSAFEDPTEIKLGIRAYLSPEAPGFSAVSKARFSDFVVHEVAPDGTIAKLEHMEPCILSELGKKAEDDRNAEERKRKIDETKDETDIDWVMLVKELTELIKSEDKAKEAITLLESMTPGDESCAKKAKLADDEPATETESPKKFVALPPSNEKDTRRKLHEWIRNSLGFCARADTVNEGEDKIIRIWHVKYEKEMPNFKAFERTSNHRGPRAPPGMKYLRCVLYKENMDTGYAMQQIQRRAGPPQRGRGRGRGRGHNNNSSLRMGYAGNKDKRGITTQFITVPAKTPLHLLANLNRDNNRGGGHTRNAGASVMRLGNFEFAEGEIRLGTLQGNRFDVVLRNVQIESSRQATKEAMQTAGETIRKEGFVNYFGTQRFGKFHDTHITGIAVLKGDYEKAVDVIMQPKEGEREDIIQARKVWQERFVNANGDKKKAEAESARRLGRDFQRGMTSESAILNSLARNPLDYKRAFFAIPRTLRMMFVHAFQSYLWNLTASHCAKRKDHAAHVGDLVLVDEAEAAKGSLPEVKVLSEEDVAAGKYTLRDVVLPLVGSKTRNPENELGQVLEKLLVDNGITQQVLSTYQDLHCAGDYRKVLCRPSDVDFSIIDYADPVQPLLQTDLMKLKSIPIETLNPDDIKDDKEALLGMVVGFTLPSSAYATIFLRELMKRPTSSEFQSKLKLDNVSD